MEQSIIVLTVFCFLVLVAGVALDAIRRGLTKKRNDYRMGQALRRGLAHTGAVPAPRARVLGWQSCQNTSLPLS